MKTLVFIKNILEIGLETDIGHQFLIPVETV